MCQRREGTPGITTSDLNKPRHRMYNIKSLTGSRNRRLRRVRALIVIVKTAQDDANSRLRFADMSWYCSCPSLHRQTTAICHYCANLQTRIEHNLVFRATLST